MAEPKRGSVEAFKAAEKKRKERVASKKFSLFGKAGSQLPKKVKEKREAFNKKVRAINEKARANNPTIAKFKQAEERRQIRLAKVNKMNPNSPKAKRIAKQVKATADVEKDLPKSKINTTTASKIGTAVGAAATKTKPVAKTPVQGKDKPDTRAAVSSFGEAFKKARAKGVGTKFAYNDKMYSAVTRDDLSKAGASSLKEFLNESKRKATTKLAKAPGQIVNKKDGGMAKRPDTKNRRRMAAQRAESMNRALLEQRRQGAAITRGELKSLQDRMGRDESMDRMKTGGSVMARGGRMGRSKPTKMY